MGILCFTLFYSYESDTYDASFVRRIRLIYNLQCRNTNTGYTTMLQIPINLPNEPPRDAQLKRITTIYIHNHNSSLNVYSLVMYTNIQNINTTLTHPLQMKTMSECIVFRELLWKDYTWLDIKQVSTNTIPTGYTYQPGGTQYEIPLGIMPFDSRWVLFAGYTACVISLAIGFVLFTKTYLKYPF